MIWFGGAPAIAGFAVANDLLLNSDGVFTSGFEAGLLLHHRGGLLIGHVPKFGNGLRIELIAGSPLLKVCHFCPGSNSATLDGIPVPRRPCLVLAFLSAINAVSGIVGLLDEATGVVGINDIFLSQ